MNKDIYILNFCNNVKRLRKQSGLSRKEMAKKLGIGIKSLSMIEGGVLPKRLGAEIIFEIYNNFGINPREIFVSQIDN